MNFEKLFRNNQNLIVNGFFLSSLLLLVIIVIINLKNNLETLPMDITHSLAFVVLFLMIFGFLIECERLNYLLRNVGEYK